MMCLLHQLFKQRFRFLFEPCRGVFCADSLPWPAGYFLAGCGVGQYFADFSRKAFYIRRFKEPAAVAVFDQIGNSAHP